MTIRFWHRLVGRDSIALPSIYLLVLVLLSSGTSPLSIASALAQSSQSVQPDGGSTVTDSVTTSANSILEGEYIVIHGAEPMVAAASRESNGKRLKDLKGQEKIRARQATDRAKGKIDEDRQSLRRALTNAGLDADKVIKAKNAKVSATTVLKGLQKSDVQALMDDGFDVRPVEIFSLSLDASVPHIGASSVWNLLDTNGLALKGRGITVGVIDTGIDWTHPALGSCTDTQFLAGTCPRVRGKNFMSSTLPPYDDNKHGTHVAGIIGAEGAVPGVAPQSIFYALKVCDKNGSCPSSAILGALDYVADPNDDGDLSDHLDVANLSLGGTGSPDDILAQAVDTAVAAGVVAVVAAGNSGPGKATITSPGVARSAITVGAQNYLSGASNSIASFSSRGPALWNLGESIMLKPDLVAPGNVICAPRANSVSIANYPDCKPGYTYLSGTSMATPHVAGVAALILQAHPDWSPAQVKSALLTSAKHLNDPATGKPWPLTDQGHGVVQALGAVQAAGHVLNISTTTTPRGASMDINGTVFVSGLSQYSVSYRTSSSQAWTELLTGNSQVDNGVLGTVQTGLLKSGLTEFKLTATTGSSSVSTYALIRIPNTEILSPYDLNASLNKFLSSSLSSRSRIPIYGSSNGALFNAYTFDLCSTAAGWCSSQGFTLTNSGTQPIKDNVLGYLEPWRIPNMVSGSYLLKLSTHLTDGTTDMVTALIYIDTTLAENYPMPYQKAYLDSSYSWYATLFEQPMLDDLDGDGAAELIFNYKGVLDVKNGRFESLPGWPKTISGRNQTPVSVGDLDGDGIKDILALGIGTGQMWAFSIKGDLLPGFPRPYRFTHVSFKPHVWASRILFDLNGDGLSEIFSPDLWAENYLGQQLAGWDVQGNGNTPHEQSQIWSYGPAIGDLDGDGENELVATTFSDTSPNYVYNFKASGEVRWSATIPSVSPSEPALGDLDGDGTLETIVIDGSSTAQTIYVFNSDGSMRANWPYTFPSGQFSSIMRTAPVSVGDIDGDGDDEIALTALGCIYVFDGNAVKISQICKTNIGLAGLLQLANLDSDQDLELLPAKTGTSMGSVGANWTYPVAAFNLDGTYVTGFPKTALGYSWSEHQPVGDIDGDGKNEMIYMGNEHIYVWKTDGDATPKRGWAQHDAGAQHVRNPRIQNPTRLVPTSTPTRAASPTAAPTSVPTVEATSTPQPLPTNTAIPEPTLTPPAPEPSPTSTSAPEPTLTPPAPQPSPTAEPEGKLSIVRAPQGTRKAPWTGGTLNLSIDVQATPDSLLRLTSGSILVQGPGDQEPRRFALSISKISDGQITMRARIRLPSNKTKKQLEYTLLAQVAAEGITAEADLGFVRVAGRRR